MTSVLAIVALLAGRFYGLVWMDPAMALVGVCVILSWSVGLTRTAGTVLLDMVPDRRLAGPSASGWRSTATASATCICGGSAPAMPA